MIKKVDNQQENVTLSFFSRVIDGHEIPIAWYDLRKSIMGSLVKLMDRLEITTKDDGRRLYYYAEPKEKHEDTIETWSIILTFLDRRYINSYGNNLVRDFRILLTFRPEVKDQFRVDSNYAKSILKDSLRILNYVPDSISVNVNDIKIDFSSLLLDQEIDVGEWNVIVGQDKALKIRELLDRKFDAIKIIDSASRNACKTSPRKGYFMDNVKNEMRQVVQETFKYSGLDFNQTPLDQTTVAYNAANGKFDNNSIIFGNFNKGEEEKYFQWKYDLTTKRLPTQNLRDITTNDVSVFPKMQTAKLEVYHKMGYRPLDLDPSQESGTQDGFLYLCRITELISSSDEDFARYRDILGSVVVYGKRSQESQELILTINDQLSEYSEDADEHEKREEFVTVKNPEEVSKILSSVGLSGLTLDLILTKKPSLEQLPELVKHLKSNGITIRKVFYFSTRYSCGPSDPERIEGGTSDIVSFKILHEKHLFYQPSWIVLGQFDIGTAYCELLYPFDETISKEDVISIVRLAKRRLYRIYNIPSLRIPEPIVVFKNKPKLIAEIVKAGKVMPLRLFI